jgi:hypothetical protein
LQLSLRLFKGDVFKGSSLASENNHVGLDTEIRRLNTKDFAEPTFYTVPSYSVSDLSTDRDPQTGSVPFWFRNKDYEMICRAFSALSHDAVETRGPQ